MNLLRALAVLAIALGLEAILGRLAPVLHGWVDLMMIPVAWYAISGSQRSAMLVGCAGGLLQDAWFQAGVFGISGFKKTLLGWAVGGLCSRLDLNHTSGRLVVGTVLSVADQLLEVALYRLLDLKTVMVGPTRIIVRAVIVGLLVAAVFPIVERVRSRNTMRGSIRLRS